MTTPDKPQAQNVQQAIPLVKTLASDTTKVAIPDANVPDNDTVNVSGATSLAGEAMNLLEDHKGKLAIGVAATLGLMVFYRWREKLLAKTDPEEYARLRRLKAVMRHSDDNQVQPKAARKAAETSADKKATTG
jgi:hypothetical protein